MNRENGSRINPHKCTWDLREFYSLMITRS